MNLISHPDLHSNLWQFSAYLLHVAQPLAFIILSFTSLWSLLLLTPYKGIYVYIKPTRIMCFMILKLTSPAKSLSLIKVTFVDSGDYDENILGPLFSLPQFLRTQISFSISGSSQQDSCHQQYISSSLWHRFVWTNPRSAHLLFSLKFAPKSKFSFSLSTLPFIQFLTLSVI